MLGKTTFKLSLSLFGTSVVSIIISLILIMTLGGLGGQSANSSSTPASSASVSAQASSALTSSAASSAAHKKVMTAADRKKSVESLYINGGLIDTPLGKALLGTICILILFGLLYSTSWHEASKDPNRVKYGHMNKFMAKGLVAGLIAAVPYYVLAILYLYSQAAAQNDVFGIVTNIVYRIANIQYLVFGDYTAVPAVIFILPLIIPIISELGYLAGYHEFSFISRIIYKNQKKRDGTYRRGIKELRK